MSAGGPVSRTGDIREKSTRLFSLVGFPIAVEDEEMARFLAGFEWEEEASLAPLLHIGHASHAVLYGLESLSAPHPVSHILRSERERRSLLLADRDFTRVTLYGSDPVALAELSLAALCTRLARQGTVLLHGAAVRTVRGEGLCFIGPAGVGKSTQVELWKAHRDAKILNGDKVFLRLQRNRVTGKCEVVAYGSPWCGSSPYRVQACGSLAGVISLHRAPAPSLRRLSTEEATATLLSRTVIPGWDDTLAMIGAAALDTVARMALTVPLYSMSCAADRSAVEAVEDMVLGQRAEVAG